LPLGRTGISDSEGDYMDIDGKTHSGVIIDTIHHKVHEGDYYVLNDLDEDVDIEAPKKWLLKTPTDKEIHIKIVMEANNSGKVEFYENPTVTDNGTEVSIYNVNRNSGNTSSLNFYKDPTVSGGTLIEVRLIGTDNNKTKIGGYANEGEEFILKKDEDYLIVFTPDNDGTKVLFNAGFYEV